MNRVLLTRRRWLGLTLGALCLPTGTVWAQAWSRVDPVRQWLGDAEVLATPIAIDLPLVAEDGSSVNLGIAIPAVANDVIVALAVFAPGNPTAEVAAFTLTEQVNPVQLALRLRLSESQTVVVAARTASGKALVSERAVRVTTSGCLAPSGAADASAEMQARVRLPRTIRPGGSGEILTLISHPMHTGLAADATGQTPPQRIIETFEATLAGQPLLSARFYRSLAANPYLRFQVSPTQGGELQLTWTETAGRQTVERHPLTLG